jgi:hypothetical protein
MSYFTEEALEKFQAMCAEGMDFSEGEVYDFVHCLMANGDVYGIEPGETCEKGKQISDGQAAKLKSKKKPDSGARMAKLKQAFLKKTGREITSKEQAKLKNMLAAIGVPIPKGQSAESMLRKILPKGEKVHPVKSA